MKKKIFLFNRDACAFYVSQIGELATHATADFTRHFPDVPWASMKGIRNIIVHAYGSIDNKILWDVIQNHIPPTPKTVS